MFRFWPYDRVRTYAENSLDALQQPRLVQEAQQPLPRPPMEIQRRPVRSDNAMQRSQLPRKQRRFKQSQTPVYSDDEEESFASNTASLFSRNDPTRMN